MRVFLSGLVYSARPGGGDDYRNNAKTNAYANKQHQWSVIHQVKSRYFSFVVCLQQSLVPTFGCVEIACPARLHYTCTASYITLALYSAALHLHYICIRSYYILDYTHHTSVALETLMTMHSPSNPTPRNNFPRLPTNPTDVDRTGRHARCKKTPRRQAAQNKT